MKQTDTSPSSAPSPRWRNNVIAQLRNGVPRFVAKQQERYADDTHRLC